MCEAIWLILWSDPHPLSSGDCEFACIRANWYLPTALYVNRVDTCQININTLGSAYQSTSTPQVNLHWGIKVFTNRLKQIIIQGLNSSVWQANPPYSTVRVCNNHQRANFGISIPLLIRKLAVRRSSRIDLTLRVGDLYWSLNISFTF